MPPVARLGSSGSVASTLRLPPHWKKTSDDFFLTRIT
jgi:hypothetical protein